MSVPSSRPTDQMCACPATICVIHLAVLACTIGIRKAGRHTHRRLALVGRGEHRVGAARWSALAGRAQAAASFGVKGGGIPRVRQSIVTGHGQCLLLRALQLAIPVLRLHTAIIDLRDRIVCQMSGNALKPSI